jgi:hypothetical protein
MGRLERFNRGLCLSSRIQTITATVGSGKSGSYRCRERSRERFFFLEEFVNPLQL